MCIIWYDPWDVRQNKKWSFSKTRMGSVGFRAIFDFRSLQRDADTLIPKWRSHDFWASRWGRAAKVKKIAFSLGRCRKSWFSHSYVAWGSTKKTTAMQHGSAKSDFRDTSRTRMLVWKMYIFLLLWILVVLGGTKVGKMGKPVRFSIFDKIIRFQKKCKKSKCC